MQMTSLYVAVHVSGHYVTGLPSIFLICSAKETCRSACSEEGLENILT